MLKCPRCDEYISYEDEMKGRCSVCSYRFGVEYQPLPPPPPKYYGHTQNQPTHIYARRKIDIGKTLSITKDILVKNLPTIFAYLLIPVIIIAVLNIFTIWTTASYLESTFTEEIDVDTLADMIDGLITLLLVAIPLTMATWILELLFAGGIVGMTKEGFYGQKVKVRTGFESIKKRPLGIIGAGIILSILLTLGIVLCLIPGLIFCYWWLFTLPILIIEGKGISDAMSSSKDFAEDHSTFGFTIVLLIIVVLTSIIMSMITGYFIGYNFFSMPTENIVFGPGLVIGQIVGTITSLFITIVAVMCITVHYLRSKIQLPSQEPFYPPPPEPYKR